ncbi:MAG TPA: hypothetical protein VES73_02415 [Lamprocystis sp. (in: g-proteobacteria)]|nr:hypothetical protein [Lamprocystis sp. (in: g-proteobacteria)]
MDRFTRNYSALLGILFLALFGLWLHSNWQPRAWEINEMLKADPLIANYPYQFRVVLFDQGTATISTPRSFDVPASRFLEIVYPQLAGKPAEDPAMVAAQQALVDAQKRAMELVQGLPDVKTVSWELDVAWLADHGVAAPVTR